MTEQLYRWVKASERLPNKYKWPENDIIHYRVDGLRADGNLLEIDGETQFDYVTADGDNRVYELGRVEWLEPIPSLNTGSLLKEYNKQVLALLHDPTDEEVIGKLNELKPYAEKEIEEYERLIHSRPSLDIDKVVEQLREANPYTTSDGEDAIWRACCLKVEQLLKKNEEK